MSGNDRPESRAFRELEMLVHSLGEELATFRKRALSAESQLRERTAAPGTTGGHVASLSPERVAELQFENDALKTRLSRSEDRVRQMLDRVRFLRQQLQTQPVGATARS
jgi:TolA-binding protein